MSTANLRDDEEAHTFAWETSALLHPIRSDRADVLLDLADQGRSTTRHVTTAAVTEELQNHGLTLSALIDVVHVDGLDELVSLAKWVQRLSSARFDRGEATVCAWAEVHGATAIIDDRAARVAASHAGLTVHGTAWVVAQAVRNRAITVISASNLVDALIDDGARYPFSRGHFEEWAKAQGLLSALS